MSRRWHRPGSSRPRCGTHPSCGAVDRLMRFPAIFGTPMASDGSWAAGRGPAMSWPRLTGAWPGGRGPLWSSTSTSRTRQKRPPIDGTRKETGGGGAMPPYSEVFRTRGYLAIFLAAALSTWGDYLARVVVAAFVLDQTGSPFAAAATFAVSLLPSIFGRSLLAPFADRVPYKYVLIVAHLLRAAVVGVLILAVSTDGPLWTLFA